MEDSIAKRSGRRRGAEQKDCSTGVFWVLLLSGLAVLGGGLLVPVWMNCQMLARQSGELGGQVEEFSRKVRADQEAIAAVGHDVAFNERLLMEELNYQRPGEQVLLTRLLGSDEGFQARQAGCGSVGPGWLRGFIEPDSRSLLLAMSGGLVFFAFVYYPPKKRAEPPRPRSEVPVRPARAEFNESGASAYKVVGSA